MNNETEDRELQELFRELRRLEAEQAPPFARVGGRLRSHRSLPAVLWPYAAGMALAATLVLATMVILRGLTLDRTPPEVSALLVSARRTISDFPAEPLSLTRSDSPTAFLLSPLTAAPVPANPSRPHEHR